MQAEKFSIAEFTAPVAQVANKEKAIRKVRKELNATFLIVANIERYFRNETLEDVLHD